MVRRECSEWIWRAGSELHERVGIVLQASGAQNDLTVRELVEIYGRYHMHRRPGDEVIELLELGEKADARARKLSGGQKRRLDLALRWSETRI
jgi:ABC-2 type transport system ATP-binding protein